MSHYRRVTTEYRNPDSLRAALADLGIQAEFAPDVRKNTLGLKNRWFGQASQAAAIVIPESELRRVGAGLTFNPTGFAWDDASQAYTVIHDDSNYGDSEIMKKIKQRYALHEVRRQARARGYTLQERVQDDGSITVVCTRR